jgi:hypothetical protein
MGNNMHVSPAALRAYGRTAEEISAQLAASGAFDLAKNVAALVPVFGLIGQDFLAGFTVAQASHAKAYGDVAAAFGNRARLAHTSADTYERSDNEHADALRAIVREVR